MVGAEFIACLKVCFIPGNIPGPLTGLSKCLAAVIVASDVKNPPAAAVSVDTSNIFAILGLRALYFLLANFMHMFSRLHYGLAIILSFIGVKMLIGPFYHISSPVSLAVVGGILIVSVITSFMFPVKQKE